MASRYYKSNLLPHKINQCANVVNGYADFIPAFQRKIATGHNSRAGHY